MTDALLLAAATLATADPAAGGAPPPPPPLTYAAEGVIAGVGVAGILLWILGRRLVRPLFGLLFAGVGGIAGATIPAAIGLTLHPIAMLGAGVVLGALVGLMLFRVSMAIALGALLGVAAPVATGVTLQAAPGLIRAIESPPDDAEGSGLPIEQQFLDGVPVKGDPDDDAATDAVVEEGKKRASEEVRSRVEKGLKNLSGSVELTEEDKEALRARAERVGQFLKALFDEAKAAWGERPASHRLAMMLAAAIGMLAGGSIGLLAPRSTAAVTTALIGSAAWLGAGAVLAEAHDLALSGLTPTRPAAWLGVWLIAAGVGAGLQWTLGRRRADKPQS